MTPSSPPKVALLGRPNVGKSTLFNRMIRSNRAITHDRPGVTRDRMEGRVGRGDELFILIDTGGVTLDGKSAPAEGPKDIRGFEKEILSQAEQAVEESELLLLVVDARDGLTPFDSHLADFLRRRNKPLILVLNKADGIEKEALLMAEFHALGLEIFACSAAHGRGVRELESEILDRLFTRPEEEIVEVPEILLEGAGKRLKKRLSAQYRAEQTLARGAAAEAAAADLAAGHTYDSPELDDAEAENDLPPPEDCCDDDEYLGPDAGAAEVEDGAGEELPDELFEEFLDDSADASADGVEELPEEFAEEMLEIEAQSIVAEDVADDDAPLRLALLGRPNAGKSSLVNALVGAERMMVSDIAGTTRDSVDVDLEVDGLPVTFVDTAGVRRRAKITDVLERYSVNSSIKSTTKAHVTLLVLDGAEGLTAQDKRLLDLLDERKTPFMVLVNKCDLIDQKRRKETEKEYREALAFCTHVPLLMVSALKGRDLGKIVPLALEIRKECGVRIGTGKLNRAMESVLARHQPPLVKGVRPKFFYLTQAESRPPTFVFFVSDAERISQSYGRFLERSLRKMFGILHAPMRVHFRSSHRKKGRG